MDEMIEVKKGLRQVEYEHPLLEQVSGDTYGAVSYTHLDVYKRQ